MRAAKLTVLFFVALVAAIPVMADWDPGDQHKMHFPQMPNPTGWDVKNYRNPEIPGQQIILADDWTCSHSGPVTDIHIWGSWRGDPDPPHPINNIHIEIWSDNRDGPFSMPGMPLWQADFPNGTFVERFYGEGDQGWYDPMEGAFIENDHFGIWQYNFLDFPEPFIQEKGTIYWLVVVFDITDPTMVYEYGWKTSLDHWEDIAVWSPDFISWQPLMDPVTGERLSLAFVITGPESELDFGDAIDPTYPTLLASDGARHAINQGPILGPMIDGEPDGQPDPAALGDDNNGPDEDGILFPAPLQIGSGGTVLIDAVFPGDVNGWIDFNQDGDWADGGEHVVIDVPHPGGGPIPFSVTVPASALTGQTVSRWRICSFPGLGFTGYAPDGEVEDHLVTIEGEPQEEFDFGDAPDPSYPTLLASNGARHLIVQGPVLGASIDAESDGQPSVNADGDDVLTSDDEDGIVFATMLVPGGTASVTVTITSASACYLNAWIDFNGDGDWADTGEQVVTNAAFTGSTMHNLPINVPTTAVVGSTYARFRIDSNGSLTFNGLANDGEVEDYLVLIEEEPTDLDFGDAPDVPYPTLRASDGARHILPMTAQPLFLGATIDPEADGQPDIYAVLDDNTSTPDDEDGVVLPNNMMPATIANITVTASVAGYLDAWVDWDQSGVFGNNPNEQVFSSVLVLSGPNALTIPVPAGLPPSVTYARFRISSMGGLTPAGLVCDGEVEDYIVYIGDVSDAADFGDALDIPYPTLLPTGAHHIVDGITYLGATVDIEPNGQPNSNANGDDSVFLDDEDGVTFTSTMVPAGTATVQVLASAPGFLDAWIDFYGNGDWLDSGEQIFAVPLVPGANNLQFPVPAGAVSGSTTARFRFSTIGGLPYDGMAPDGEVEDYAVSIADALLDLGDAPDPGYNTLIASNGARHVIPPSGAVYYLGTIVDSDADGQPTAHADGDDLAASDDEDGVTFLDRFDPGATITVRVIASTGGYLNAWLDLNGDDDWDDAGEQIFTGEALVTGSNDLTFDLAAGTPVPETFARFRFTSYQSLNHSGLATDGEVEDYWLIGSPIFADDFESGNTNAWSSTTP